MSEIKNGRSDLDGIDHFINVTLHFKGLNAAASRVLDVSGFKRRVYVSRVQVVR